MDPNLVPYTTNFTDRVKTTAALAVGATALVIIGGAFFKGGVESLAKQEPFLTSALAVPTPMALFGILYKAYDKWLWKWRTVLGGSGIPNLSGQWQGFVTFEDEGGSTLECEVEISQTWTHLGIRFLTTKTHSSVIMAALNHWGPTGGLRYEYLVVPDGEVKGQPQTTGTARLDLRPRDSHPLSGDYENRPQEYGGNWVGHFGAYRISRKAADSAS